jgi:hypothetical protein
MSRVLDEQLALIEKNKQEWRQVSASLINPYGYKPPDLEFPDLKDSLCQAYCGLRGGGKSILAARQGRLAMLMGIRVLSNMDIHFDYKGKHYQSEKLDANSLYIVEGGMEDALVIIDEAQEWGADNHDWQSWKARLLEALQIKMRKRHLGFIMTMQDEDWFNNRLAGTQIDVLVKSLDLARSDWGRIRNMQKGFLFSQTWFDLSGNWLGRKYRDTGWFQKGLFKGGKFWLIYETEDYKDVLESFRKAKVDLEPDVYTDRPDVKEVVNRLTGEIIKISRDHKQINGKDLWQKLGISDFGERVKAGTILRRLGAEKKGTRQGDIYNLSNIEA